MVGALTARPLLFHSSISFRYTLMLESRVKVEGVFDAVRVHPRDTDGEERGGGGGGGGIKKKTTIINV